MQIEYIKSSRLQKSFRERQITAKQCSRNQNTNVTQSSKNVNF